MPLISGVEGAEGISNFILGGRAAAPFIVDTTSSGFTGGIGVLGGAKTEGLSIIIDGGEAAAGSGGAAAAGTSGISVGTVLGVAGLVLTAAEIYKAWQHAKLMRIQETNLSRIKQLDLEIKQLETQQKVLSNNLLNQLNQTSQVINSKAVNTNFAQKTLNNIIPYNSIQLPSISGNNPQVHTIKKGENLTVIARQYGITTQALWEMNQSTLRSGNPNLIYPGEQLTLPNNAQKDVRISKVIPQNNYNWSQFESSP